MNKPTDKPGVDQESSRQMIPAVMKLLAARRPIIIAVVVSTLLALGISLVLPKWYKSTTALLPPKNQSVLNGLGGVTSLLKDFLPVSAGKGLGEGGSYNFLALLNSRRAMEKIVHQFDLFKVYDIDDSSMEETLHEFENNYDVEVGDDGTIRISVLDRESLRAAEMANYAVTVLNELNVVIGATESRSNREFLEKRLKEYEDSLSISEDALRVFQEDHGVVMPSNDVKSAASSYVGLYAKKVEADIELSVLEKTVGNENPAYKQKKLANDELAARLDKFPRIGMESLRLFRQVMINQKILEVLLPLYEQARVEEAKDIPAVVVLDQAVPAEKKSRPFRLLIVLTAFITSLSLSVLVVLMRGRLENIQVQHPELVEALRPLTRYLPGKK